MANMQNFRYECDGMYFVPTHSIVAGHNIAELSYMLAN